MSRTEQLKAIILAQNPTEEQTDAIFAPEYEFLLRASPGSGKTWTSCRRFLWRAENWENADGGLALLSFTNTAVREFETAMISAGRPEVLRDPHFIGTFDSFVERFIISPFGHLISGKKKPVRLLVSPRPGHRNNPSLFVKVTTRDRVFDVPAWEIVPVANGDKLSCRWAKATAVAIDSSAGFHAMKSLLDLGFYAHSHRNFWACHLLRIIPRLPEIIARRFPEMIIDEAQDTGLWLLRLLQHLRSAGSKVTLVGDPDQCIYEFNFASVGALSDLKQSWGIMERPLNKSFRCNDVIANAVRHIGENKTFEGCGAPKSEHARAYVIGDTTEDYQRALAFFREKAAVIGVSESDCAILCRGHDQVAAVRGTVRYLELQGKAKQMAEAAFLRDKKHDFKGAVDITEDVLRQLVDAPEIWRALDEQPESEVAGTIRLALWQFVRAPNGLPPLTLNGDVWIEQLRANIGDLITRIGVKASLKLGSHFQRRGLKDDQTQLPLFTEHNLFPALRFETIHKAKGQSIGGVLVVGAKRFFDAIVRNVMDGTQCEERRLGYVAMTRARHLLVLAIPADHLKKHNSFWRDRAFEIVGQSQQFKTAPLTPPK